MTDDEAGKLLVVMVTAWPDGLRWHDERQQDAIRRLYRQFLSDLDYRAADQALARLVATWKPTAAQRWPTIAELRSAVATVQHGRTPSAGEAWGALRALRAWQDAAELGRLDPALRACIEALGWIRWDDLLRRGQQIRRWRLATGEESEVADRARFLELYEQLAGRATSDRVVGQLAPPIPVRRLTGDGKPKQLSGIVAGLLPDPSKEKK